MVRQITLSLNGRCDRCGARAKVRVRLPLEGMLDFCGHHYAQHKKALTVARAVVVSQAR